MLSLIIKGANQNLIGTFFYDGLFVR